MDLITFGPSFGIRGVHTLRGGCGVPTSKKEGLNKGLLCGFFFFKWLSKLGSDSNQWGK